MKTIPLLIACTALASAAQAALLLQENFDGLNTGNLNGQNGWTAKSGVSVAPGGLSYSAGSLTVSGGANRVESTLIGSGSADYLATKGFAAQSSDVWFSFTLRIDTSDQPPTTFGNGPRFWFWVSDTTDISTGVTGSVTDNNTGNKNLSSEIRLTSTPTANSSGVIVTDSVYFLVARLSKDGGATLANAYDRLELWVNPTSTSIGAATISSDAPASASFTGGIANFGLTTLSTAADLQWDNLRIGTTRADVVDVYAIPEPASFAALAGLAGLGLAATRRRRRA